MVIATIWKLGFHLPNFDLRAFHPQYLNFTLGGYARILALMTGIEIFANLVAAYEGPPHEKSRKAFRSLLIIMGTTTITMLVVGPAILQLANPVDSDVSVFTQAMDQLLPAPLPYAGTLIGIFVLASAAAASAQGLQNLALGLHYRHYIPAALGTRNKFDVADKPVWLEVAIVSLCYLLLGTNEELYLAVYAAGVFILLSMTGWAVAKRLTRNLRTEFSASQLAGLVAAVIAASLTSAATLIIFVERFREGAWTYLIFVPVLYFVFNHFRTRLGEPRPLDDHLGRIFSGQYLLPLEREGRTEDQITLKRVAVPLDGTAVAEHALPIADLLARYCGSQLKLLHVQADRRSNNTEQYLAHLVWRLNRPDLAVTYEIGYGEVAQQISELAQEYEANLIVMSTHGMPGIDRYYVGDVANKLIRILNTPVLLLRPTEKWQSRTTKFRRLLVTLDGSEAAEDVLRYTRFLARVFQSEILLLSVPEAEAEKVRLTDYLETVSTALRESGYNVTARVAGSGAVRTILESCLAEEVDLIMMTTHGRGVLSREASIGSVADRVIDAANCPVFLVPVQENFDGR
jgi:nucleotide-binding universal stress UspA family protein